MIKLHEKDEILYMLGIFPLWSLPDFGSESILITNSISLLVISQTVCFFFILSLKTAFFYKFIHFFSVVKILEYKFS